jgi:hypothetical protein
MSDKSHQAGQTGGTRLGAALRRALREETTPPHLEARIRQALRERELRRHEWRRRFQIPRALWLPAGAALLAGVISLPFLFRSSNLDLDTLEGQAAFIDRISAGMAPSLKVGLADHVHCAVLRKYPSPPPSPAQVVKELGRGYDGLFPAVEKHVPAGFSIVIAHHCTFRDRGYTHLVFRAEDSSLLSLVVTERAAEDPSGEGLIPSIEGSGISVYGGRAEEFEIAEFEAARFLVYVVSTMSRDRNLHLAASVAPAMRDFLTTL